MNELGRVFHILGRNICSHPSTMPIQTPGSLAAGKSQLQALRRKEISLHKAKVKLFFEPLCKERVNPQGPLLFGKKDVKAADDLLTRQITPHWQRQKRPDLCHLTDSKSIMVEARIGGNKEINPKPRMPLASIGILGMELTEFVGV